MILCDTGPLVAALLVTGVTSGAAVNGSGLAPQRL